VRIPQLHQRRFFTAVTHPDGRPRLVPGAPFHYTSGERRRTEVVHVRASGPTPSNEAGGPLTGLRVIDFGHVWAGPYCAALLADMGAEVIKIESRQRVDIHRRQGPYARGTGIDRSGVWNAQNRGKRSVSLNLSTEQGRSLARRLVARADVALENFAPGVMQRLGLDYASLYEVKPSLVMASLSAFGQQGPQRSFVGYGPSLDAWASLDWLTAYPGGAPNALGGMFPDTGSAIHAAAAILAALHHRDRTGEGRYIDVSELEVSTILVADVICAALCGREPAPCGNRDRHHFPHDCYACAGQDRWVALSTPDRTAWYGLSMVIGHPQWRDDPALATSEGRRLRAAEIDGAITEWTRTRDAHAVMAELQAAGVPAAVAHTPRTLLDDPHLRARGFFQRVTHPDAGAQSVYGPIWRFSGDETRLAKPAPMLGADNEYVLRHIVGLPVDENEALIAAGVIQ
jgi:benzylsuccinate CoA-transferase BbsF subunit